MKKKVFVIIFVCILALTAVFFLGRYGWKLLGFKLCSIAWIDQISVSENEVNISGSSASSNAPSFLGYYSEEANGTLYIGFCFNEIFGVKNPSDFSLTVPTKGEITDVYMKTAEDDILIWSESLGTSNNGSAPDSDGTASSEAGSSGGTSSGSSHISALVEAYYADDEALERLESYYTYTDNNSADSSKIIIYTDYPVKDFKIVEITYEESDSAGFILKTGDTLYSLDELTADIPLVAEIPFGEVIPLRGIVYTDANGTARQFAITMSGKDGSLILMDY